MTAAERRKKVIEKYRELIGRNIYSQSLRDYCFRQYKDGKYYSDCSSSICYSYKEAGEGFGIHSTAGIYQSSNLVTVDLEIKEGIPDTTALRPGDMLEFAGDNANRPQRIGHVEMVYSVENGIVILCGHGSGQPSYKEMTAYCRNRYQSYASGGWRKGLVCVRRYIQDDIEPNYPDKPSGWQKEADGWRFYLGDTGLCVRNSWYLDADGAWYWFDGAGRMVCDVWYQYKGCWYYLGSDGAMRTGLQCIDGSWYYLNQEGKMATKPVLLTPDQDGALLYPGLAA